MGRIPQLPAIRGASLFLGAVAALIFLSCTEPRSGSKPAQAPPLEPVDYGAIVRDTDPTTISLGPCPMDLVFDGEYLWVINNIQSGAPLHRVDPEGRDVKHFFGVGKFNTAIALVNGDLWLTSALENRLYQVRRDDGAVLREYETGPFPYQLASNGKYVWTSNPLDNTLTKVDIGQRKVASAIPVGIAPHGLLFDEGLLWVRNNGDGALIALDPETDTVRVSLNLPPGGGLLARHGQNLWVANYHDNSVTKIDPVKGEVVGTYPVGRMPWKLASDGRRLWVTNSGEDTVSQIDPETGSVIRTISSKGPEPLSITYVQGHLWMVNSGDENLIGNLAMVDVKELD